VAGLGCTTRTYVKFIESGAAFFASEAVPAGSSNTPSIVLRAASASAKELNGEPVTLTAPVRE
jgi:hypothetical protein